MSKELTKHTPTPWPHGCGDNASIDIVLPNNTTISIDRQCRYKGEYVISREEMEANARLIVKAVNNHEALIEALKSAAEQIRHDRDVLGANTLGSPEACLKHIETALKNAEQ